MERTQGSPLIPTAPALSVTSGLHRPAVTTGTPGAPKAPVNPGLTSGTLAACQFRPIAFRNTLPNRAKQKPTGITPKIVNGLPQAFSLRDMRTVAAANPKNQTMTQLQLRFVSGAGDCGKLLQAAFGLSTR
jgi:hypothetical protein